MEHPSKLAEARCDDCDRYFVSNKDLIKHKQFCSKILLLKNEAEEASGLPEEGIQDEFWLDLDGRTVEYFARMYAEMCLIYLNEQDSQRDYKLVKPGHYQEVVISGGPITHLNFKAKAKDGPVETFFAQLKTAPWPRTDQVIDFCVSLGLSEGLPHWSSAYLRDCCYCKGAVHHPYPGMDCDDKLILGDPLYYASRYNRVSRNE